jgi:hypothetical protein
MTPITWPRKAHPKNGESSPVVNNLNSNHLEVGMEAKHTAMPMTVRGTAIYLANNSGGFDLRGCPNPEALAQFIVRACNAHDYLVKALQSAKAHNDSGCGYSRELEIVLDAALTKAGAA